MKVVITGADGFLGWHTACRLRALHDGEVVRLGREALADPAAAGSAMAGADAVLHLAGTNRAPTPELVYGGNVDAAHAVAEAMRAVGSCAPLVYANSIHAGRDTAYGRGKARAAELLAQAASEVGATFADVRLPNLFGEHGRPGYNSFVATFCSTVADGGTPEVTRDDDVPLLHAQAAAGALVDAAIHRTDGSVAPETRTSRVSSVLSLLQQIHRTYARGELPALTDDFERAMFNTYRSYVPLDTFPRTAVVHSDPRGDLFETVRVHGGRGQSFVSTTRPGSARGDHYHLSRFERFFVVSGEAEIGLRRMLHDDVTMIRVGGERPGYVDMPTLWVHNIRNVGSGDLVTQFWSDQLLDDSAPDQFAEPVIGVPR